MNIVIKASIRFLLSTLSFFLLFNVLAVPILLSQGPQEGAWYFSARLISYWDACLLAALIGGFLSAHLFLLKNPKPLLGQLGLFPLASLLLYSWFLLLPHLQTNTAPAPSGRIAGTDTIFYASNRFIWTGTSQGTVLKPVLIYAPQQKEKLRLFPEGVYDPAKNSLRILLTGENIPLHDRIHKSRPLLLETIVTNLKRFSLLLYPKRLWNPHALLYSVSVAFFLTSLYSMVGITRWLLFNYILSLSLPLLTTAAIVFLEEWGGIPYQEYLPAIIHGGSGVLCFAFQPFIRSSARG